MSSEPMTDRQLHVLAKEIRMAFATHAQGPVAAAMQRTADKDVVYLIEEYQRLRAEIERLNVELFDWDMRLRALESENRQLQEQNGTMRPMIEALASRNLLYYSTFEGTFCVFCKGYMPGNVAMPELAAIFPHKPDCLCEQARAFMTAQPTQAGEETGE